MTAMRRQVDALERQVDQQLTEQYAAILARYGGDPLQLCHHATPAEKQVVLQVIWPPLAAYAGELLPLLLPAIRTLLTQRLPVSAPDSMASPASTPGMGTSMVPDVHALLQDVATPHSLVELRTQLSALPTEITDAALLTALRWYQSHYTPQTSVHRGRVLYDTQRLAEYAALFEAMEAEFVS